MENPYTRAPFQATVYDVVAGAPVRSYMLLGDVPRNVLAAAQKGTPCGRHPGRLPQLDKTAKSSAWPEATWGKSDAAALQRHYGPRWRWLLTPRVGAVLGGACDDTPTGSDSPVSSDALVTGGDEDPTSTNFGNLDDFDDIDIVLDDDDVETVVADVGAPKARTEQFDWDPRTVYSNIATYPEDTFADLKAKIYAATGIPPYRQHLFYPVGGDEDESGGVAAAGEQRPVRTTYRITVEGGLVLTDIRRFAQEVCAARRGDTESAVANIPIDRRLEERKEDVRVDALDSFRTLEESPGVYVRQVFVADLELVLRAYNAELRRAIADQYQFDLLYYGFAMKYWPELSPEAFRLAVSNPEAIAELFPQLDPPVERIQARLQAERAIIDNIYTQTKAQQLRREREEKRGGVAVTAASVNVDPRAVKTPVNIRNVFDWIPATRHVPAVVARVGPDGVAAGRRRDYILEKTHVSAASPQVAAILERFLSRTPRRPGVSYAIMREHAAFGSPRHSRTRVQSSQPQFVFFTIYEDGRYTVESSWREDDRVGFDEVVHQLSAAGRPIIGLINKMGAAALPLGGTLETPAEASKGLSTRTAIDSLTVSTFWPHALSSEGFRLMKTRWREYEKAGIVGIRGLQQAGAYAFHFRKGITNYDPRALEKIISRGATSRQVVTNHYAHLTDFAAQQRWQCVYPGRLVRVYHRTTDLRIEIVNVDMEEFQRIQLYVFVFLDSLIRGPKMLKQGIIKPGQSRTVEGRLRGLQERDPDLYDLKKYDDGATVYSVLCQGDRQPEMLTEEEVRALGAKRKSALVKYWNFTESRPAYYSCPSKRFPHLSFRAGEHPLGYCLPCCKKTQALPGSKAQAVNKQCLDRHQVAEDDLDEEENVLSASRHVLSYGKPIPVGRVSHVPQILTRGLLYDSISPPFVYRLIGVTQQTAALPQAGFFYSLAAAMSLEPEEFVRELADTAQELSSTYQSLANGGAAVFTSAADLADAIVSTFLPQDSFYFSPFMPGGMAADSWKQIIADLVHIRYDIDVVVFADESGDGDMVFEASAAAAARIRASAHLMPVDVAVLVTHPSGTYLLAAMEQREFLRHGRGRGPARRFFSSQYEDEVEDRVVDILRDMVASETSAQAAKEGPRAVFNLEFVSRLADSEGYQIVYRLINLRDQCYGVVLTLTPGGKEFVYFPVMYSPHFLGPAGDEPAPTALYGPRPEGVYPAEAVATVLAAANRLAAKMAPKSSGERAVLRPSARLVADGRIVGFIAEAARPQTAAPSKAAGIYFHHDPVAESAKLPWAAAPLAAVPYDMREVDRALYEAGGVPAKPTLPEDKAELAREGLYLHRLYRLFLAEFAALLREERNDRMRQQIKTLFGKTRFSSPSSLADFRQSLSATLANYPGDADAIRGLIAALYTRVGPLALRKALDEAFDATAFDFDRTTLTRLRALDSDAVKEELARLMRAHVEIGDGQVDLENIYVACSLPSDVKRPQCEAGRLKMTAERYSEYVSILAADILNPMKAATLGTMTSGVVDGARFVTRPGERIHIR